MPLVASWVSRATTSSQLVPLTGFAISAFCAPANSPSTGLPACNSLKFVPEIASPNGLRVRSALLAAITVPSLLISRPLLCGVG